MEVDSTAVFEEDSTQNIENNGMIIEIQNRNESTRPHQQLLKRISRWWMYQELRVLFSLAFPITLTLVLQQLILFVSLILVGRITHSDESLELDTASLGNSYVNITGLAIGLGLSTAADTLCAQTYGFKNYKRVGVIFQRGVLILLLVSLFVFCIWLNTESILLLVQQEPCVAKYTSTYVQIYILALPPLLLYVMLQKYLQSQGIVWPFIIAGVLTNIINVIFHVIFLFALDLGVNGAAAALVITNYFQPAIIIIYVKARKLHKKTWGGWSWESLEEWGQFLKLGIPGTIMLCLDWVSFEISTFVLGSINEVELAINGILINYLSFFFMIPLGISIAASVRVGNELGAGNPVGAKRAAYISIGVITVIAVISVALLQGLKDVLADLYNAEDEVKKRIQPVIDVVCGVLFTDQLQGVISGILRGAGHQLRGAVINFIAFYIVGLPIGISLALVADLRSLGIWIGLLCASITQCVGMCIALFVMNWKKESEKAMKRGEGKSTKEEELDSFSDNSEQIVLRGYGPLSFEEEEEVREPLECDVDNENPQTEKANEEVVEEALQHDDNDDGLSLDEMQLIKSRDEGKCISLQFKSHLKLVLCHSSLLLTAVLCVIVAGIISQFHPPDNIINGNYSECSEIFNETEPLTTSELYSLIYPSSIIISSVSVSSTPLPII